VKGSRLVLGTISAIALLACARSPDPSTRAQEPAGAVAATGPAPARVAMPVRCADIDECSARCDRDDGDACFRLAELVAVPPGGGDLVQALALSDRACAHDSADGCLRAALYRPDDVPEREALFVKACELGLAVACRVGGVAILGGSRATALRLLERACALREAMGCTTLARAHIDGGRWADATAVLDRACSAGDGSACALVGSYYLRCAQGRGVGMLPVEVETCQHFPAPDPARAAAALGAACEGTAQGACWQVATLYREGTLVAKDPVRAARYHEIGCRNGVDRSCRAAAEMYATGDGVATDLARALALLETGCPRPDNVRSHDMAKVCLYAAELYTAAGRPADAAERVARACDNFALGACDRHGAALEAAGERDAARAIYRSNCENVHDEAMCKAYVRLGGTLAPTHWVRQRQPGDL
jgi:TPR repeat protein